MTTIIKRDQEPVATIAHRRAKPRGAIEALVLSSKSIGIERAEYGYHHGLMWALYLDGQEQFLEYTRRALCKHAALAALGGIESFCRAISS